MTPSASLTHTPLLQPTEERYIGGCSFCTILGMIDIKAAIFEHFSDCKCRWNLNDLHCTTRIQRTWRCKNQEIAKHEMAHFVITCIYIKSTALFVMPFKSLSDKKRHGVFHGTLSICSAGGCNNSAADATPTAA